VDEQVKPQSLALAPEVGRFDVHSPETSNTKSSWKLPEPKLLTADPSPVFFVGLSVSPFFITLELFGLINALQVSLFSLIGILPSFYLGLRIARRVLSSLPQQLRAPALTVMLLLMSIPANAGVYLALIDTSNPGVFLLGGSVTFAIFGWVVLLANALFLDLKTKLALVADSNDQLRWAIARVNLLAWYNKGVSSRLLHGPIQNAMHATLLTLRAAKPEMQIERVLETLRNRIAFAAEERSRLRIAGALRKSLQAIETLWEGISEVEIVLEPKAAENLAQDLAALEIVLDVVSEICSNAIRHGVARKIDVRIESEPKIARVIVVDDGQAPVLEAATGLGKTFLDSCAVRWGLSSSGGKNRVVIELPCETGGDWLHKHKSFARA
jgi:signal transduction histidine kinase